MVEIPRPQSGSVSRFTHCERYRPLAQGGDIGKMKMLVKLGLEFLRHAQNGQAGHTRARTAAEATDRAGTTPRDEDDAGNART